jgi:hypothetical protein
MVRRLAAGGKWIRTFVPRHRSRDFVIRRKDTTACRVARTLMAHGTASPFAVEPKVRIHFPPAVSQANFGIAPLARCRFGKGKLSSIR